MGGAHAPGPSKLAPGTHFDSDSFVSRQGEVEKMCLLLICEVMGPTPRSTTSLKKEETERERRRKGERKRETECCLYLQLFQLGESLDGFGKAFQVVVVQISETKYIKVH